MKTSSDYQADANQRIDKSKLSNKPKSRLQKPTLDLIEESFVIDVHTHFFDIKCINKAYFAIRAIKDLFKIRGATSAQAEAALEYVYMNLADDPDDWAETTIKLMEEGKERGIIKDIVFKILWMGKMSKVYKHYRDGYSLAEYFGLPKEKVITTALMMDLEQGWGVKLRKTVVQKITELKKLSIEYPVLPFLACDPSRADEPSKNKNLYSLFNKAFCEDTSFFGVKIYPALGFDVNDHRLWPIYNLCEKFKIPVLSHCGGSIISTDKLELDIYRGDQHEVLTARKRQQMADHLNDPNRWSPVLDQFPKLKLNLAHFGGGYTWLPRRKKNKVIEAQNRKETIWKLMKKYTGVYADFSFNFAEDRHFEVFHDKIKSDKTVRDKTLYGTDYWVVFSEGNMKKHQTRFLNKLKSDALRKQLCRDNGEKYLWG